MRHSPLDTAVIIARHIRVDRGSTQRPAAHLRTAVDPRRPSIHPQSELEDQLCVPLLTTTGDSYRLTHHTTKGREACTVPHHEPSPRRVTMPSRSPAPSASTRSRLSVARSSAPTPAEAAAYRRRRDATCRTGAHRAQSPTTTAHHRLRMRPLRRPEPSANNAIPTAPYSCARSASAANAPTAPSLSPSPNCSPTRR